MAMMHADPYEMLSAEEMTILKEHYHLVKDCRSQDEIDRALKGWTKQQRQFVSKLQDRIRESGWTIDGVYPSGSIRFSMRSGNPLDQVMALSDEEFERYRRGQIVFVGGLLRPVSC